MGMSAYTGAVSSKPNQGKTESVLNTILDRCRSKKVGFALVTVAAAAEVHYRPAVAVRVRALVPAVYKKPLLEPTAAVHQSSFVAGSHQQSAVTTVRQPQRLHDQADRFWRQACTGRERTGSGQTG